MARPEVGDVIWHRGKGATICFDASLPILVAMDYNPKSGGKKFAGLAASNEFPCMHEVLQD